MHKYNINRQLIGLKSIRYIYAMEQHFVIEKKEIPPPWDSMDGPGEHQNQWNNPEEEKAVERYYRYRCKHIDIDVNT